MTAKPAPVTIDDITFAARNLADARTCLGDAARDFDAALQKVRDLHEPIVRPLIEALRVHYDCLIDLVKAGPDLFTRPKSVELHGLKIGLRKAKGRVEFADVDKLVKRLKALKSQKVLSADTLDGIVTVKVKVSKSALSKLDANVLKRLGVDVVAGDDEPFAQPLDSEVDKLVKLLFGQDEEEE